VRDGGPLAIDVLMPNLNLESMKVLAVTQVGVDIIDWPSMCESAVEEPGHHGGALADVHEARMYGADDRPAMASHCELVGDRSGAAPLLSSRTPPVQGPGRVWPPLWQAYAGRRRPDGLLEIPCLELEVGAERLHHAPMLVVSEAIASSTGCAHWERIPHVDHLTMTFVAPAGSDLRRHPVFCAVEADTVGCRVELRDEGLGNRLVAATFVRMQAY